MLAIDRTIFVSHLTRRRSRQGGFNFAEVLFAIMILSLGFIMVAALFPVALQQTKLTGEEVVASTVARGGTNYAEQIGLSKAALPVSVDERKNPPDAQDADALYLIPAGQSRSIPGRVFSFRDDRIRDPDGTGPQTALGARLNLWRQVNGNLILPSDNRAGWVLLYRRSATYFNPTAGALLHNEPGIIRKLDPFAQVIVVGVQQRNRSVFESDKDTRRASNDNSAAPSSLEPRQVFVKLSEGNVAADRLTFHENEVVNSAIFDEPMAAEGAFVIISDDRFSWVNTGDTDQDTSTAVIERHGQCNGRIYRLGAKVGAGDWELVPGWDMKFINPNGVVGNADDIHENIPPRAVGGNPTGLPAIAFIVGRGYADPADPYISNGAPGAGFEGGARETGVYTTFIQAQ